ncbi:hypothetical protein CP533_3018 [Ophiocordyceps camponoti-saundersi (nom. inval.)]|nr:hypothetical protein CP533_3018 [Ophiocordyceps camponoti-saundersi (nom. inval.)]
MDVDALPSPTEPFDFDNLWQYECPETGTSSPFFFPQGDRGVKLMAMEEAEDIDLDSEQLEELRNLHDGKTQEDAETAREDMDDLDLDSVDLNLNEPDVEGLMKWVADDDSPDGDFCFEQEDAQVVPNSDGSPGDYREESSDASTSHASARSHAGGSDDDSAIAGSSDPDGWRGVEQQLMDWAVQASLVTVATCGAASVQSKLPKRSYPPSGLSKREAKPSKSCCANVFKLQRRLGCRKPTSKGNRSRAKKKLCKHNRRKSELAKTLFKHKPGLEEIGRGNSKHTKVTTLNDPVTKKQDKKDASNTKDPVAETGNPFTYVFHASPLPPSAAEKRTGFLPPDLDKDYAFGAFASLPLAADRAAQLAKDLDGNATVYLVAPTPNILSDPKADGYLVIGGIRYSQVIGSISFPRELNPVDVGMYEAGLKMTAPYNTHFYKKNDLYEPKKYGKYSFTWDVKPSSLKTRQAAKAFMKANGTAVDWPGDFPLFRPPKDAAPEWSKPPPPYIPPWLRGDGRVGV